LRELARASKTDGLVVLGSGSIPWATRADYRAFVQAAAGESPRALTNNRYSADVVAVAQARALRDLPDVAADNAVPRWLAEVKGYEVEERRSWRLRLDLDSPLDLVLMRRGRGSGAYAMTEHIERVGAALDRAASVAQDPTRELIVAGRTSSASLAWLERHTACRVRVLVEERGLRASDPAALLAAPAQPRPPASVLGALVERDGPARFGELLAGFGDAALVDTRVLLAHRLGRDESNWPSPEDRFSSDLLLHERIADPWVRELTRSALEAAIPIVLGGHTLVGPGIRLALR